MRNDLIRRQDAIDIERRSTVDTNPEHFKAHQKFNQFLDDAEISSFGRWQWSNGFNTALTAVGIDLKKLPSAQPEKCEDCVNFNKTMFLIPQPEPQWIPCSERLPEDGIYVLGYMAYGQCSVLKCEGGRLYTAGCWVPLPKNAVTHWQYLPDVPKEAHE